MYKNATVQNVKQCIISFKKKKNDPYLGTGKNQKLCHNPNIYLFPWAWEGKPLAFFKNFFKNPKVCLSDSIPLNPKDALV